ncbi:MAG: amidohydrolase family protein, partial [Pseudoclavibacter sp.]
AHAPSTYLSKLWFDTVVHDPAAVRYLVETAGADRVVLGTDYPFDMGVDAPLPLIRDAGLPEDAANRILGANAAALEQGVRGR